MRQEVKPAPGIRTMSGELNDGDILRRTGAPKPVQLATNVVTGRLLIAQLLDEHVGILGNRLLIAKELGGLLNVPASKAEVEFGVMVICDANSQIEEPRANRSGRFSRRGRRQNRSERLRGFRGIRASGSGLFSRRW